MRALAAIFIVAVWSRRLHAIQSPRAKQFAPLRNIFECGWTLGPTKCLNALGAWRAERAINSPDTKQNLIEDIERFPWNRYRNSTDEQLYTQLCDGTERLLQRQSLSLTMVPGYRLELLSKGNGTINVDVYKNNYTGSSRGMKKAKKMFYNIVPFLAIPGLIMAAILPFILPALKMLTLGAVMINNMAFTGAVFTLLRNNAFNDKYEHKIIYANYGYKNEHKHAHTEHYVEHHDEFDQHHDEIGPHHAIESEGHYSDIPFGHDFSEDHIETIEETPLNVDWNNQQYSSTKYLKRKDSS